MINCACKCANGRRTAGCYLDVAAIIYDFSYARYLSEIIKAVKIVSELFSTNDHIRN